MSDWISCPHCHAQINADADFCRHCGSSDEDGWADAYDDCDDDFDYEQFVDENFGSKATNTANSTFVRFVALVLLTVFVLAMFNFGARLF